MEQVSHLKPEEAYKIVSESFKRMADQPVVSFKNAGWTPSGDVMVEFNAKRQKAILKARIGARVSSEGRIRGFSDLGLRAVTEGQGPSDAELAKLDAEDAVKAAGVSLAGLLEDLQTVFPRAAIYDPKSKAWVVRLAAVRVGQRTLSQWEAKVNLNGLVTKLKKRKSPI
jgi:hypothetical protein